MNENLLPDDLSTLSDEDLASNRTRIDERAAELRALVDNGEVTDDDADEIVRLADERDRLTGEADKRSAAAADRQEKAQAGLSRLSDPADEEGETETKDEAKDGEEAAEPETVAAATEAGPTMVALPAETVEALTQLAQLAVGDRVATPARTTPRSPAQLAAARPSANRPRPERQAPGFMEATAHAPIREGSDLLDTGAVAELMCDARNRMGHVPSGVSGDRVSMACSRKEMNGEMLSNDPTKNFGILRDAVESARSQALVSASGDPDGLAASGGFGYCNIYTPMYEFYRIAERQTPIEDDLSTIPAPRAGIQYMQPMDWRAALEAVGSQDKTQQEANEVKSFLAMTCPEILTAEVIAVYQIVQFDNLQFRVFKEQAEAFLEDVAMAFDFTKESYYLSQIAAKSTTVSSCGTYGTSRSLYWDWVTAGTEYRKRNAMKRDSTLKLYAPDWSLDQYKLDLAMDAYEGLTNRAVSDAEAIAHLKAANFDPVFYNDLTATAGGIAAPQAAGALHKWPTHAKSYIHSPGSFGRLDAGTLDVGLVRDSVLNGTNDVQMFMEEWIGVAFLGLESIELVSCICPSGVGPLGVAGMTCP